MIPYGHQDITDADIKAVIDVLKSDYLTQGPAVPRFEQRVADHVNATHAIATNNATSALHLACRALGLGPGDWLWTSPITFVASANCALYCGARVDFVDIDPRTWNMDPAALETKLKEAKANNRLPKIVVPVHLAGQSCDMQAIHALSQRYGFRIIEDASHAIGGKYQNHYIGDCRYSDITVFSFHPVKIITTAEGGMTLTNDDALARKMELLRSHGISRDPALMTHLPDGPWYYQQIELGYNYRMTELQAALGASQMQRLDAYVARRHQIAQRYDEQLADLPLMLPWQHPDTWSAFHLYTVRVQSSHNAGKRREVFDALRAADIGVNVLYIPVHLQPWYQQFGFRQGDFPQAEEYYAEAIALPLFPTLTESQQDHIIGKLHEACCR
jgi:UDP-4-amino-4,6-dideoxy-N-acetyl-beta-L-altrosamine transaminase